MGLGNVILRFASKALVVLIFFWVSDNFRFFTIPVLGRLLVVATTIRLSSSYDIITNVYSFILSILDSYRSDT
jgi:hypothetical protein